MFNRTQDKRPRPSRITYSNPRVRITSRHSRALPAKADNLSAPHSTQKGINHG